MLSRLTVAAKVLGAFALAIVLAALLAVAAQRGSSKLREVLDHTTDRTLPRIVVLQTINESVAVVWGATNALAVGDLMESEKAAFVLGQLDAAWKRIDESWRAYGEAQKSAEEEAAWRALQPLWAGWERGARQMLANARQRQVLVAGGAREGDARLAMLDDRIDGGVVGLQDPYAAVQKPLATLVALATQDARAARDAASEASDASAALVWSAFGAIAVALAVLAGLLGRSISRAMRAIVAEASRLTGAVHRGELRVRAEPSAVGPEFRPILLGMNETMEAFTRPIGVTADYVDRIARGDIPPRIEERYEGDFNAIKDALNACVENVNALVRDADALAAAAVDGRLDTRADATRHPGDFGRVVAGVNRTLDAVLAPIQEAAAALDQLAHRDLTARVRGDYRGGHARIRDAVNATGEALQGALARVSASVEQVSSASSQIASSSQSVADGASEQASSIEETSAQLQTMSAMTRQSSDHAQAADGLARQARASAGAGAAATDQMTAAMGRIRASAEGTSAIIKDINEIAFQTNLLALNAAVEAARAGEAGRGFAVVAEEVRALALRSKEAATRTEALIQQAVRETAAGAATSSEVAARLGEIVAAVGKVGDIVAELGATAREQTAGIDQVNRAVAQMDHVTQQNAASAEESSSAAAELSGQAEELAAMIAAFRLGAAQAAAPARTDSARAPAPPPPAAASPRAAPSRRTS